MDKKSLENILNQLHGMTFKEVEEILEANPELLTLKTDSLLKSMIGDCTDTEVRERLIKDREFLKLCREKGIKDGIRDKVHSQWSDTADNLLNDVLNLSDESSLTDVRELIEKYPDFEIMNNIADQLLAEILRDQPDLADDISPLLEASQTMMDFLMLPKIQELEQTTRPNEMPSKVGEIAGTLESVVPSLHPDHWWRMQVELGNSLVNSSLEATADGDGIASNIEDAIVAYNEAFSVIDRDTDPIKWAWTAANMAIAYLNRINDERTDNIERSIALQEEALVLLTKEQSSQQASINLLLMNLATTYMKRLDGSRSDNIEIAIKLYKQTERAVEDFDQGVHGADVQRMNLAINLGNAFYERIQGDKAQNLLKSIQYHDDALNKCNGDDWPNEWAMIHNSLGNAYSDHPELIGGQRADNLKKSIEYYNQAHRVYTLEDYPKDWAMVHNNLATSYYLLGGEENFSLMIQHFQHALKILTIDKYPIKYLEMNKVMGNLYFERKQWANGLVSYQNAINAGQQLLSTAYTETGRKTEVQETASIYTRAAYCLWKLNRLEDALCKLEQGKTRLLVHSLALDEIKLSLLPITRQHTIRTLRQTIRGLEGEMRLFTNMPGNRPERELIDRLRQARIDLSQQMDAIVEKQPDFLPVELDVPAILRLIPTNGVLIVPCITPLGSFVYILPSGTLEINHDHVLDLPNLTEASVWSWLLAPLDSAMGAGWLHSYAQFLTVRTPMALQQWQTAIAKITRELWQNLMGPIHEQLATYQLKPDTPVLIMPQGGLGLLPLHAAWRHDAGEQRTFLDDYTVTYAFGGFAQAISQRRQAQPARHSKTLCAVINPTGDLSFTPLEGEAIAALFAADKQQLLTEAQATADAFQDAIPSHAYIHYSGHGSYNWQNPMQSGLYMANGSRLTLSDTIAKLDLSACRLVTLSACETGISDIRQSPDEYVGLPAGFLQAGAPAVVSTLWAVDDLSTMLLMERFYQLHLQDGLEFAPALRQAQLWLRELTAGELTDRFRNEVRPLITRMAKGEALAFWSRFEKMGREERPFVHPYYWAAFTLTGA